MIVAERKPMEEILEMIGDRKKVVLAGCGTVSYTHLTLPTN